MSAYSDAVKARNVLRGELWDLIGTHNRAVAEFNRAIAGHQQIIDIAEAGGPSEVFAVARELLDVRWLRARDFTRGGERTGPRLFPAEVRMQFRAAIEDLQAGCKVLRREYLGVKEYDRFTAQEVVIGYGYTPTHGSVWFSIGLKDPAWPLTDEETIACVQWLRALQENPELLP